MNVSVEIDLRPLGDVDTDTEQAIREVIVREMRILGAAMVRKEAKMRRRRKEGLG